MTCPLPPFPPFPSFPPCLFSFPLFPPFPSFPPSFFLSLSSSEPHHGTCPEAYLVLHSRNQEISLCHGCKKPPDRGRWCLLSRLPPPIQGEGKDAHSFTVCTKNTLEKSCILIQGVFRNVGLWYQPTVYCHCQSNKIYHHF